MKNIIVGTAGHIDHGKTTLIKALTGVETDRLEEEKKRGISIDLGFTYFDLPSGVRAGIIDVPGHERFIRNMLAGVVGMDVVILVVAADEGLMPQSVEHLHIMDLLGIENGFIALTKTDMVDPEWLELVEEDVKEGVAGTFLEGKPVIPVSSTEGIGIEQVKEEIDKIIEGIEEEDPRGDLPRLAVDRSFSISGFGTVVTGTLLSGILEVGEEVQLYPMDKIARIRSIQVHDQDVKKAYKGQRVALNLADVTTEEASRGVMIAPPGSMEPTDIIDVEIHALDNEFPLDNRTRLRLYIGTEEVFCRLVLLDRDLLEPKETALVQLRLEEKISCRRGDKFILRLFSPMITIGGGHLLDANPKVRKRFDEDNLVTLELMSSDDSKDVTEAVIIERSDDFPSLSQLAKYRGQKAESIQREVEALEEEGKIIVISLTGDLYFVHKSFLDELVNKLEEEIRLYHKKYPLRYGMSKEELRVKYFKKAPKRVGELFIDLICQEGSIEDRMQYLAIEDFSPSFTSQQEEIRDKIVSSYKSENLATPRTEEIFANSKYPKEEIREVFNSLNSSGIITRASSDVYLLDDELKVSVNKIVDYLKNNGEISLADARDLLYTNRRVALAILEYMDSKGLTKRDEKSRTLA